MLLLLVLYIFIPQGIRKQIFRSAWASLFLGNSEESLPYLTLGFSPVTSGIIRSIMSSNMRSSWGNLYLICEEENKVIKPRISEPLSQFNPLTFKIAKICLFLLGYFLVYVLQIYIEIICVSSQFSERSINNQSSVRLF